MEIKILEQNNEKVVVLNGRLDTMTSSNMEMAVSRIWAESGITLVFDCTGLEYVSSSGLRVILSAQKQVAAHGSKLILRHLSKDVLSVLELTGFAKILTIE
ncbi:MAG: STAS domain-containing protein [Bacteroidaceae bacterium]|nr:STAS domain-containing protein [Bacteroidaceae bacterium]